MRFVLLFCFVLFCSTVHVTAQNTPPAATDLQGQFDAILRSSSNYRANGILYKTVPVRKLNGFMGQVNDSLGRYAREIDRLEATIADQAGQITQQEGTIATRQQEIGALNEEKDNMSLLGVPLDKTTYSIIMWSAILGLLALLLLALGRMRVAVANANEARTTNEKISADLEKSRKNRLEVEQKLRRQLQDEVNKRKG